MHLLPCLLASIIVSLSAHSFDARNPLYEHGKLDQSVSCEELGKRSEEASSWETDYGRDSHCILTFVGSSHEQHGSSASSLVLSNVSFSAPKKILSDFLLRLATLKFRAGPPSAGRSTGGVFSLNEFFGPLEQHGLRYTCSLCFPRLSLLWEWLSGAPMPLISRPCCSQDCWWAAVLKKTRRPSLLDLLQEASTTSNLIIDGTSPCGFNLADSTEPQQVPEQDKQDMRYDPIRLLSPVMNNDLDSNILQAANLLLRAAQSIGFALESVEAQDLLFWTLWLVSPGFMVAHRSLEFAQDLPLMCLYVTFVAAALTFSEYYSLFLILANPQMSGKDKVLNLMIGYVVISFGTVFATILLSMLPPLLESSVSSNVPWVGPVLWASLLALPMLSTIALPTVMWLAPCRSLVSSLEAPSATERHIIGNGRRLAGLSTNASGARRVSMTEMRQHATMQPAAAATNAVAPANGAAAVPFAGAFLHPPTQGRTATTITTAAAATATAARTAAPSGTSAAAAASAIHWPPPLEIMAWLEEECEIPYAFRCPITLTIMREPTSASSGITYERHAIFQWLSRHRVDPVTHVPLKRHRLTPNLNLRCMIENWIHTQTVKRAKAPDPE